MLRYRDFFLTESWKDYVVSTNPETLLYDFYVLSYLTTLPLESGEKGFAGTFIGRDPKEIRLDIKEAESKLLPALRDKLSEALFVAICAEIRHVIDNKQNYVEYKDNALLKNYLRNYTAMKSLPKEFVPKRGVDVPTVKPKETNYLNSFNAATKAIRDTGGSREKFVQLAADLFRKMKWSDNYGGENWANIAEAYLMLIKTPQSFPQLQVAIDHAYDLQHNTGTVLNKVSDYYIQGDISWLKRALDFKANLKSVYELLPKCSSDMRKLALETFKTAGVKKDSLEKTTPSGEPLQAEEPVVKKQPKTPADYESKDLDFIQNIGESYYYEIFTNLMNNSLYKRNQNDSFGKDKSPSDPNYLLINSINEAIASAILSNIVEYILYDTSEDAKIVQVKEVEEVNNRLMSLFNKHKNGLRDLKDIIKKNNSSEGVEKFKDFVDSFSMELVAREIVGMFSGKHFSDFLKIMSMIRPHPKDSEFKINPDEIIPPNMFKI